MSLSLEDSANDRKSRLAALRQKRKSEKISNTNNISDEPISDRDHSTERVTGTEISSLDNHTHTHTNISRNFDQVSKTPIVGSLEPPTLKINNEETVEVIASKIEQEIFIEMRQKALHSSFDIESQVKHQKKVVSHNKDLKAEIESQLNKAKAKTEQAINKIIQKKYEETLS